MPKMTQGFDKEGNSQWFEGSNVPEGFTRTDPNAVITEPEEAKADDAEDATEDPKSTKKKAKTTFKKAKT
jgi:hypothetical protein